MSVKKLDGIIISMKKKFFTIFCASLALLFVSLLPGVAKTSASALTENENTFYSEKNAPMFYGTTEITIDKDVVSTFDLLDGRFRILAKDFEDGDLTPNIVCTFNDVQPTTAGEYRVDYEVKDSHQNVSKISVPVHVLDKSEGQCKITRRVYAIPSLSNLSLVGTERCNNGDSQILGIYLPVGSKAQVKILSQDCPNLKVTYFANTNAQRASSTIKVATTGEQYLQNTKDTTGYDSVPILTSPRLNKEKIDQTYDIELSFDSTVKALDYFHYKDSEQDFKNKWKTTENTYGVVDGEAIMAVVPFADVDKLSGYVAPRFDAPFESLDTFFEYYLEVVNRMDAMLGLSLNPQDPIDQNYRTKYLAVADASTGNGAYYNGSFIAVGSASISPLFQYGWGTLHEIGHGYQGYLGRGGTDEKTSIFLNETGNNILAHYIQIDPIYHKSDRYIGNLANCEANINSTRKNAVANGKTIFNNNNGTYTNTQEKLYCIVNLLDNFEGEQTYGKLFQYYRRIVKEVGKDKFTVPEIYAKFFAEEYNANIIPYLTAWTMSLSDDVIGEILNSNAVAYSITSDTLPDSSFEKVFVGENLKLKYGLISDEVLAKCSTKSEVKLNIQIDDFNLIKGKNVVITQNGNIINIQKISANTVIFNNLDTGTYEIKLPIVYGYDSLLCMTSLQEGDNDITYTYSKMVYEDLSKPLTVIKILGIHGTLGYSLTFNDGYKSGSIVYGAADLGNQGKQEWIDNPDSVYVSVTIKDSNGEVSQSVEVKGVEYFWGKTPENASPNFEVGSKICIFTHRPTLVGVYLKENNKKIDAYSVSQTEQNIEYEITENGLKLLNKTDFDEKEELLKAASDEIKKVLNNAQDTLTESQLANKRLKVAAKNKVLNIYSYLSSEDQAAYANFISQITGGGKPTIAVKSSDVKIKVGERLDLYSLIEITDNEDFVIQSNSTNVKLESNFDANKAGEYVVKFTATDSDGNTSAKEIIVKVLENQPALHDKTFNALEYGYLLVIPAVGIIILIFVIVLKRKTRKKH